MSPEGVWLSPRGVWLLCTLYILFQVALVFKTDEAASFAIAFWGCIFAAVIPVAIQPPITKDVSFILIITCGRCFHFSFPFDRIPVVNKLVSSSMV